MSVFELVKANVTAYDVAVAEGFNPTRNKLICCPFHNDKHPSMKVDKRFYCFSCGEKIVAVDSNKVLCPVCGKMTPKGKFCIECGAVMERKCPNCGAELPANGKFCLECGTKLQ